MVDFLLQNTSNFSLNKQLFTKLHLGIGGELRVENYQLYSGELASYKNINPALEKASGSYVFLTTNQMMSLMKVELL